MRDVAVKTGADYLGFMFYHKSARYIELQTAQHLRSEIPSSVKVVAVVVDAGDEQLAQIIQQVEPDMIQAHGAESPARIEDIRTRYGCEVIKAIPVASARDVEQARLYQRCADVILFDTKTRSETSSKKDISGGAGQSFDWHCLAHAELPPHWMLAGGLNVENLTQAVRVSGASCVDVSSGVESRRGEKDSRLVAEFLEMAKAL